MVVKTITQSPMGGHWLIREDHNYAYDRISIVVDNGAGTADVVLAGGYPMKIQAAALGSLGVAADVNGAAATIVAAVLEPVTIPKGEKRAVACASKGFNVINQNMLPTADYLGVAFTAAGTLADLYVTNMKWVKRVEATTQTEQST